MEQCVSWFRAAGSGPPAKQTCRQCRQRKVRCDGRQNGCTSCERLDFVCSLSVASDSSHPWQDDDAMRRPPRRRASRACRECRQQKVRCSETLPRCVNCARRNVSCSYPPPKRPLPVAAAAPLVEEHEGESHEKSPPAPLSTASTKSSPTRPRRSSLQTMSTEERKESACVCPEPFSRHRASGSSSQPPWTPPSPISCDDPNQRLFDAIDSFFQHEYALPSFSFLHPPSTKERCRRGQLDPTLTLAIVAVTMQHAFYGSKSSSNTPRCPCRGDESIQQAEQLIWTHIERPSIPRLQALLLAVNFCMQAGRFQRAFMLAAMASRSAVAMRLNHERADLNPILQETRRRIMWSLKIAERYFSIGLPEFELCPFESIYVRLPSREEEFDQPSQTERAAVTSDEGAYRLCLSLEYVRRDVMKLTRTIAFYDSCPQLPSIIWSFERTLRSIAEQLPHGAEVSFAQVESWIGSPWLPRYVALYLSWHQCHCDLYRLLLVGFPEAAPISVLRAFTQGNGVPGDDGDENLLVKAERITLHHASAIVSLLTWLNQLSSRLLMLEFDTGICAYQAARLVMFISRFGRDASTRPTAEFATSRAELCLAALRRFFPKSKLVGPIIKEMERSISLFIDASAASQEQSNSITVDAVTDDQASPHRPRSSGNATLEQLSAAEKVRQRLAVHSLLRRADFPEGDEESKSSTDDDVENRPLETMAVDAVATAPASATEATTTAAAAAIPAPRFPIQPPQIGGGMSTFSNVTSTPRMPANSFQHNTQLNLHTPNSYAPHSIDRGIDMSFPWQQRNHTGSGAEQGTTAGPTITTTVEEDWLDMCVPDSNVNMLFPLFPWYVAQEMDWTDGEFALSGPTDGS